MTEEAGIRNSSTVLGASAAQKWKQTWCCPGERGRSESQGSHRQPGCTQVPRRASFCKRGQGVGFGAGPREFCGGGDILAEKPEGWEIFLQRKMTTMKTSCITQLSLSGTKCLRQSASKQERFSLAQDFIDLSHCYSAQQFESMVAQCIMTGEQRGGLLTS